MVRTMPLTRSEKTMRFGCLFEGEWSIHKRETVKGRKQKQTYKELSALLVPGSMGKGKERNRKGSSFSMGPTALLTHSRLFMLRFW
jgi:hypothetical protein